MQTHDKSTITEIGSQEERNRINKEIDEDIDTKLSSNNKRVEDKDTSNNSLEYALYNWNLLG